MKSSDLRRNIWQELRLSHDKYKGKELSETISCCRKWFFANGNGQRKWFPVLGNDFLENTNTSQFKPKFIIKQDAVNEPTLFFYSYMVFGNEHCKSFCLLLALEISPVTKTCVKSVLYVGNFWYSEFIQCRLFLKLVCHLAYNPQLFLKHPVVQSFLSVLMKKDNLIH